MRKIWVNVNPWDKNIVTTALEGGADGIMVPKGYSEKVKKLGKIQTVSEDGDLRLGKDVIVYTIKNSDDEILLNRQLNDYEVFFPEFNICNNDILVSKNGNNNVRVFMLENFSTKYHEGKLSLTVNSGGNEYDYEFDVAWISRPLSLSNTTFAEKILNNIFSYEDLAPLRDSEERDNYDNLVNFWSKYDRDTTTAFNEVMNEFYLRVDKAAVKYKSVNEINGAETDRGKIYIKYGEPDEVERKYSERGEILVVWKYIEFKKEFVFADASGLGNYSLIN